MPADAISYVAGGLFGIVAIIGLFLNTTVLLAMYRGKMFTSKASPVYILSSQTILVDTLLLAVHLGYQCPSVMLQVRDCRLQTDLSIQATDNTHSSYCWYHNSLSHILVAVNRLFVIVFFRTNVFTRRRTIALCILQHAAALGLSITSQFLLPCCEFTYSWVVYSYQYNTKKGMRNYSNEYIDVPLNTSSSLIAIISYTMIIAKMRTARIQTGNIEETSAAQLLHKEYRYALQFATMATVYSLAWIFFRVFPILIGNTSELYIYGVITVLAEMNMFTNSTVYLVNNKEIKKSLRAMRGIDNSISKMEITQSNVSTAVTT
ncbi:hypothetical protein PENTCL1PPCAC_8305, partial [Pristionchus entomophagus]